MLRFQRVNREILRFTTGIALRPAEMNFTRVLFDGSIDRAWMAKAACKGLDPSLFYPERGESIKEARAICALCVVNEYCREYVLKTKDKFGIWAGTSERQRRELRKQRKQDTSIQGASTEVEDPEEDPSEL